MAINTVKLNYTLIYDGKDTLIRLGIESYFKDAKKTYGENFIDFDFTNTQSDSSSSLMVGDKNKSDNVSLKWNSDKKSIDVTIHQDEDFNTDAKAYLSINFLYKVITKSERSTGFTEAIVTGSPIDVSFFVHSSNDDATQGKPNPSVEPYYIQKVLEEKTNVKTESDPVDLEAIIGSVDGSDIIATIGDVKYIVKEEIQLDKISHLTYTPNVPPGEPGSTSGDEYTLSLNEDTDMLEFKKNGTTKSSVNLRQFRSIDLNIAGDYDNGTNFGSNIKHYLDNHIYSDWINSRLLDGPDAANGVSNTVLSNASAWGKMGVRLSTDEENFELTYREHEGSSLNVLLQFPVSLVAGAVNKNLYTKQEVDTLIDNLRKELKPDS
nr:MAG TPA: hypothetical protein [Caudoviricetes sp.]